MRFTWSPPIGCTSSRPSPDTGLLEMPFPFAAAIMLMAGLQTPTTVRTRAEDLARAGRSVEAIELFTRIVDTDPADLEARLWVARLQLRLGRTDAAGGGLPALLRGDPARRAR